MLAILSQALLLVDLHSSVPAPSLARVRFETRNLLPTQFEFVMFSCDPSRICPWVDFVSTSTRTLLKAYVFHGNDGQEARTVCGMGDGYRLCRYLAACVACLPQRREEQGESPSPMEGVEPAAPPGTQPVRRALALHHLGRRIDQTVDNTPRPEFGQSSARGCGVMAPPEPTA